MINRISLKSVQIIESKFYEIKHCKNQKQSELSSAFSYAVPLPKPTKEGCQVVLYNLGKSSANIALHPCIVKCTESIEHFLYIHIFQIKTEQYKNWLSMIIDTDFKTLCGPWVMASCWLARAGLLKVLDFLKVVR